MERFTQEQITAVVAELKKRTERIKTFEPDTLKEELSFIGYVEAYEGLAAELEKNGGLKEWD